MKEGEVHIYLTREYGTQQEHNMRVVVDITNPGELPLTPGEARRSFEQTRDAVDFLEKIIQDWDRTELVFDSENKVSADAYAYTGGRYHQKGALDPASRSLFTEVVLRRYIPQSK